MKFQSDFLRRLHERGFIHQCTNPEDLDAAAASNIVTAYVGFDCTAPSLHIGNLLSIMMLRQLQQSGHRPIVLLGGGTTRIGDPSGKEVSRKLLDEAQIEENIRRIKGCFQQFLRFDESLEGALLENNRVWLDELVYIDFLRDYGRHFSVNRMLTFDSVKQRLERQQPLSFLEFNYMVFQAFDFLELARRHDCTLQMGGADQWGNIVNGVELAHKVDRRVLYGLTTALITTASGQKMGKTAAGALWLDGDMTSPWEYWQYWRNVEDEDVGRFLRLFTDLPGDEIVRLEGLKGRESNEAKKILADEATRLLHGATILPEIHAGVEESFGDGLGNYSESERDIQGEISRDTLLRQEYGLLQALADIGLASSNTDARHHVREGAVRINGAIIKDEKHRLGPNDMADNRKIRLSIGKKRHRWLQVLE